MQEQDLAARARSDRRSDGQRLTKLATDVPAIAEVLRSRRDDRHRVRRARHPEGIAGTPQAVRRRLHLAGVVVLTAGTYGNVIRLPSSAGDPDELLDDGLDVL